MTEDQALPPFYWEGWPQYDANTIPMIITNDAGEEILRLTQEGKLILPQDADPSEAARKFVESVEGMIAYLGDGK